MSFVEQLEQAVVDRLDRRGDEYAAGRGQRPQMVGMFQQVLHLDGHIVSHCREFRAERPNQP